MSPPAALEQGQPERQMTDYRISLYAGSLRLALVEWPCVMRGATGWGLMMEAALELTYARSQWVSGLFHDRPYVVVIKTFVSVLCADVRLHRRT